MSQCVTEHWFRSSHDPATFVVRGVTYAAWACTATPGQKKYAKIFEKTQRASADAMRRHQATHLRALLLHAYKHVPFYRRSMEDAGITPLDIQTLEDLARLPLLTRWYLEHHHEDLIARDPGKKPTDALGDFFICDHRHRAVQAALRDRSRQNAGLYPWMRYASMGERESPISAGRVAGAFTSLVEPFIERRIEFDLSSDREGAFESYLGAIRKRPPDYLLGVADLVSTFAHYCSQKGISDIRFKGALIEGGVLSSMNREMVESVFRTEVFSQYGCEHIPFIAWQCSEHAGLHVNEDAMILELEPLPGSPPGHGRVLVTDLFNFEMPLIRFEVGDVARWSEPNRCPCGCSLQRIAAVEGSVAEYMSQVISDLPSNSRSAAALGLTADDWTCDQPPDNRWMN